ncbi:MAG: AAA family ATPase [Candidatus Aenigmarchaeota archaeon]|nr:AAA family ATPase [Candidatus Aenigmarchaeota archaeon]
MNEVYVNHSTLRKILINAFEKKYSVYIEGYAGIGKSYTVKEVSKELAKKYGREFIELNKSNISEVRKNVDKYWVYVDLRLSIYDATDLKGIPYKSEYGLIWEIPEELNILSDSRVYGTLFLDELNQAMPSVMNASFQIILDRKINGVKLSDNILIVGAGNRLDEQAYVYKLPKPLINRFCYVKLKVPSIEEWIDFAIRNNVDERVIGFVLSENKVYDYNDMQENYMSPRSLVMLSNAIKGVNDYELIESIAIGFLGRVYGMKFANFVRLGDIVGKIYENVELINEYAKQNRLDIIYAFISNLYNRLKDDFNKYEKYIDAILNSNVSADLKYVLVRLLLNDSKLSNVAINKFVKKMKEDIEFEKMVERIMKYVSK